MAFATHASSLSRGAVSRLFGTGLVGVLKLPAGMAVDLVSWAEGMDNWRPAGLSGDVALATVEPRLLGTSPVGVLKLPARMAVDLAS